MKEDKITKPEDESNLVDDIFAIKVVITDDNIASYLKNPNNLGKLKALIKNNESILEDDLISIRKRKNALSVFKNLLDDFKNYKETYIQENNIKQTGEENIWQHFFENNKWIFGVAIEMRCLVHVDGKLEQGTTGSDCHENGRRADGYMRTKAEISQAVLIEIKKPSDSLLEKDGNHKGC